MSTRILVPSATRTTSGNSGTLPAGDHKPGDQLTLLLDVTAFGGTSPTLDVAVEWSHDDGSSWRAATPAQAFAQIGAATGHEFLQVPILGDDFRIVWTIAGGGGETYNFAVTADTE